MSAKTPKKSKPREVYEYCFAGGAPSDAAKIFGINTRTVKKYCRDHGLEFSQGVKIDIRNDPAKMPDLARKEVRDTVRGLRAAIAAKSRWWAEQTAASPSFVPDGRVAAAVKAWADTVRLTLDSYPGIMELEEDEAPEETGADSDRSARQRAAFGLGTKKAGGEG